MLAFNQLPMLEIDDAKVVQSQTINRYLARRGGLYGRNDIEAMKCDMIADGIADFMGGWLGYSFQADAERFITEVSQERVSKYAPRLEALIGGKYSVGTQLTHADGCARSRSS